MSCKQPSSTTSVYSMYTNNAGPKMGEKSVCSVIPEEKETPAVTQDVRENMQLDCTSQSVCSKAESFRHVKDSIKNLSL